MNTAYVVCWLLQAWTMSNYQVATVEDHYQNKILKYQYNVMKRDIAIWFDSTLNWTGTLIPTRRPNTTCPMKYIEAKQMRTTMSALLAVSRPCTIPTVWTIACHTQTNISTSDDHVMYMSCTDIHTRTHDKSLTNPKMTAARFSLLCDRPDFYGLGWSQGTEKAPNNNNLS